MVQPVAFSSSCLGTALASLCGKFFLRLRMSKLLQLTNKEQSGELVKDLLKRLNNHVDPQGMRALFSRPLNAKLDLPELEENLPVAAPEGEVQFDPNADAAKANDHHVRGHLKLIAEIYPEDNTFNPITVGKVIDEDELFQAALQELKTGEDAIAFFAKNGTQTALRFVYCKTPAHAINPYDLEIVSLSDSAPPPEGDFVVISSGGIVQVKNNRYSEVISLAHWMRQSLCFAALSNMAFFRYHHHRKTVEAWKGIARRHVYLTRRESLRVRILHGKPQFVQTLLKLKSAMRAVESVKLLQLPQSSVRLDEFSAMQESARSMHHGVADFDKAHADLVAILHDTVTAVDATAKAADSFFVKPSYSSKTESLSAAKERARLAKQRKQIAHADLALLGTVVRLADVMLKSSLFNVVAEAANSMFKLLDTGSKIFNVTVSFTPAGPALEPKASDFSAEFAKLWRETVRVVSEVASVSRDRKLHAVTPNVEKLSIATILDRDETFVETKQLIESKTLADLEKAQIFSFNYFSNYKQISQFGSDWDEPLYSSTTHTLDEVSRSIATMKSYSEEIEKLKSFLTIGVILVDGKQLRQKLTPIPVVALTSMKKVVAQMAKERCSLALLRVTTAKKELEMTPSNLQEFAAFNRSFVNWRANIGVMREEREACDQLFSLLKTNGAKVPIDELRQLEKLQTCTDEFINVTMLNAGTVVIDLKPAMIQELTDILAEATADVKNLRNSLSSGVFVDSSLIDTHESVQSVLDQLGNVKATLTEYKEQIDVLKKLADEVEYIAPSFEEVVEIELQLSHKLFIWETCRDWLSREDDLVNQQMASVDVHALKKDLKSFLEDKSTRAMGDAVFRALTDKVNAWMNDKLGAVAYLVSECLEDRHRSAMLAALSMPNQDIMLLTVSELVDNGLFDRVHDLAAIVAQAEGEQSLVEKFKLIESEWHDIDLPINIGSDGDLPTFGNVKDIEALIKKHTLQVQSMSVSKFAAGVNTVIQQWTNKLQRGLVSLKELLKMEELCLQVKPLFTKDELLNATDSLVISVKLAERFWRELFRHIQLTSLNALDVLHSRANITDIQGHIKRLEAAIVLKNNT